MTISELARQIANAFNLTDIKYICADLGIDYEVLPKDNKEDTALELVLKTKRESQLQQLVDLCRNKREHLTWVVPAEQTIPKPTIGGARSTDSTIHARPFCSPTNRARSIGPKP